MDPYPSLPPPPPARVAEIEEVAPEAPTRSAAKAVLVVVGLLAVLSGVVVAGSWWLGGPGVCDRSTVESARFGYCVAAPGWELTNEAAPAELPYDELIKPADASTVRIMAIQLQTGQGLDEIVQAARDVATENGMEVGEVVERRVAGVAAVQWDLVLEAGQVEQQVREIVFVRGDAAWRVQLQADTEGFDSRAEEFESILGTWTFR
ncbi:MAG TPA: hypothetical protein VMR89_06010 [Actinomycetota bacterium]|nr:hypothetical protein [Actinomycetota bacterium]